LSRGISESYGKATCAIRTVGIFFENIHTRQINARHSRVDHECRMA